MLLFLLFLSCTRDFFIAHEIDKITYETITETEYVYIQDTAQPPADTSPDLMPLWVDSFVQPNTINGLDIIWVIDKSGSMVNEATQVILGIETMMNALPQTNWRLVMINISSLHTINDQTFPLIPGDTIVDAQTMYYSMTGSGREEGFNAVTKYIAENPYSATWMRDDAGLLIVFVSDEDEQSYPNLYTASMFTSWLGSYRQDFYLTSIVHLQPADSICNPSTTAAGDKYIEATDNTGGTVIDICTDDWTAGITDAVIGTDPYEYFELTKNVVYPQYLQVFYDGLPAPMGSFTYEPSNNRVIFNPMPAGGTLVEIGYYYQPYH
jgi:hypothetical protein